MAARKAEEGNNDTARLTRAFLKIKAARAELAAEFKSADALLAEKQDAIKEHLLQYLQDNGMESVRTAEGLFYRGVKTRYWTSDWASVYEYVLANNMPELFEKRLNQGVIKELMEEGTAPSGVNTDSEYVLTIRSK